MDNELEHAIKLLMPIYFDLLRFRNKSAIDQVSLDYSLSEYERVLQIYPKLEQILLQCEAPANEIFRQVGEIYQQRDQHPQAIDCFTRAIYLEPTPFNLFQSRRKSYLAINDHEKAAEDSLIMDCLLKINLLIEDYNNNNYENRSETLFMAFKPIFESYPNILSCIRGEELLNLLGQHFQADDQDTQAIACFTLIINRTKKIVDGYPIQALDAFRSRAKSYQKLGDTPAAEQDNAIIERLITFKGIDADEINYKKELMEFALLNPKDRKDCIKNAKFPKLAETAEQKETIQNVLVELDDFVLGSGSLGVVVKGAWLTH